MSEFEQEEEQEEITTVEKIAYEDKAEITNRYFCVFFVAKNETEITKENKRTKVVEAVLGRDVEAILVNQHNATYIKSIRDLENPKYYTYNDAVHRVEMRNNYKNENYEKEK